MKHESNQYPKDGVKMREYINKHVQDITFWDFYRGDMVYRGGYLSKVIECIDGYFELDCKNLKVYYYTKVNPK